MHFQAYTFITSLALLLVFSYASGRFNTLPIDFSGASIALSLSFIDTVGKMAAGQSNEVHINVIPILFYLLSVSLTFAFICIILNGYYGDAKEKYEVKKTPTGFLYSELLYWLNISISVLFITFSFNLMQSGQGIFSHDEYLFDFVSYVFHHDLDAPDLVAGITVVVIFCVVVRYYGSVHKRILS